MILLAAIWPSAATAQTPINSFTVVETGFNYALHDAGNLAGEVFTDPGSLGGLGTRVRNLSDCHGPYLKVVGGTGLEPVTPTVSL